MASKDAAEELTRDEWLSLAAKAADSGDGEAMAEAIWNSGLPKVIAYSLKRKHRMISDITDAEFLVADAVAELYRKIKKGERVENPAGLLWTVAGRRAIRYATDLYRQRALPLEGREVEATGVAVDLAARTLAEVAARSEAIGRLRTYVARLGAGRSVTRLWTVLVDAIEEERHLTGSDLAAMLDMTPNHVGVLRYRGRREIEAMMREDGLGEAAQALSELIEEQTVAATPDTADEDETTKTEVFDAS